MAEELNLLQQKQEYLEIEIKIRDYISLYELFNENYLIYYFDILKQI